MFALPLYNIRVFSLNNANLRLGLSNIFKNKFMMFGETCPTSASAN
jgi:hypothetical protein